MTSDRLRAWWPALLWAALIFYASTDTFSSQNTSRFLGLILRWLDPVVTQDQVDAVNVLIRKCAHFGEYFVFYLLVYRGVSSGRAGWRWSRGLGALFLVATYSALDEMHQYFAVSRTASLWDSVLDLAGAIVGMLGVFLLLRFFSPGRQRRVAP